MNLTQQIILAGLAGAILALVLTVIRHKRFESSDIAVCLGAFIAGANFPPSVFLCVYAIYPDAEIAKTRLGGYEWYLFFAGLAAFLFALDALITSIKKAYNG